MATTKANPKISNHMNRAEPHHTVNDQPLLDVHDLSVSFGHGESEVRAVKNVSLTIERGETVALVGESGSGKSVTALSMMQLLPYPFAHHPGCLLYTSPSPRDGLLSRMPSSA